MFKTFVSLVFQENICIFFIFHLCMIVNLFVTTTIKLSVVFRGPMKNQVIFLLTDFFPKKKKPVNNQTNPYHKLFCN